MIIFEKIVDKNAPTHAIIWKWITYDSGWLNLKTAEWLPIMKDDMWGAGAVIHLMKELDDKVLNVNLIAVVPLAENMLWSEAYRPGDIIKSYCWKTVEILNTDAEGRLILADAISYASKNYNLDSITTIATLTWACLFALGHNYAGIMWDNR
jgi:leucyl aminopeptidase